MLTTTPQKAVELNRIVWTDPERMSGAPCFSGTRVPVKNLFDYLEGGQSVEAFLADFEGVSREQAVAVLHLAIERLIRDLEHA